jgi:excinuclease ABC subunit A
MKASKSTQKHITVTGAREHNLKNISVAIPKDSLTVITGPSGSGKSTLALDILYAEGQRRYIESLSSYARQFLGNPKKPDVDKIEGLCPAIAINQKTVGTNPRSTIGTMTEIYDHLRVLFARIGHIYCPQCGVRVQAASPASIAASITEHFSGKLVTIAAPIAIEKKGEFLHEIEELFQAGHYRFLIDGKQVTITSPEMIRTLQLKKSHKHTIDVLLDAFEVAEVEAARLFEALERAFSLSGGLCKIIAGEATHLYSAERMCIPCGISFTEIEPRLFSFNSPLGACKQCHGLGVTLESLYDESGYQVTQSKYTSREVTCSQCAGKRLNKSALSVTVGGKNIWEISELPIKDGLACITQLQLTTEEQEIARRLIQEIVSRYTFLMNVGLSYLSLNRTARTISGGEGQRIRLATQLGSALSGVLYILDEPSIGLHQRDNDRLIKTLQALRDLGNTVVVVEHDHDTMLHADYLIDMGPAAGRFGGEIVAIGTPEKFVKKPTSLTGEYLSGKRAIQRGREIRKSDSFITLNHASVNNLKDVTVSFPLKVLSGVSGVSGSGKSSLVMQALVPAIKKSLLPATAGGLGGNDSEDITGIHQIEDLVVIDQSPIGRTSRSNPATYLGIFDEIRALYAGLPESNARGYKVGRFSFNMAEGRCKKCAGNGDITISMHFLPDVTLVCSACKGLRYNQQTLEIT